jgi:hypothetical protein
MDDAGAQRGCLVSVHPALGAADGDGGVALFAAIPLALDHPRQEAARGHALPPRSDEGCPHGEEARAREGSLGRSG